MSTSENTKPSGLRLPQTVRVLLIAATGCVITLALQFLINTKRTANDESPQLIKVQFGAIAAHDQWIQDYDIYIAASQTVRTQTSYLFMVIAPKPNVDQSSRLRRLEARQKVDDDVYNFELTGFSTVKGERKRININPRILMKNPSDPALSILDFIDRELNLQSGIELRSI